MTTQTQQSPSTAQEDRFHEFCEFFLELSRSERSGTLRVVLAPDAEDGDEERAVSMLFQNGALADLDLGTEDSILVQALLSTDGFSDREVKKYRKRERKKGGETLGVMLFELDRVSDEELLDRVQEILISSARSVFLHDIEDYSFLEHPENEVLEGFNNELSQVFDLLFAGEDIFIDACRHLDRWDLVEAFHGNLLDIYYATPSGMRYYNQPEAYEFEIAVIKQMDGTLDLGEVIERVELSPFDALQTINLLIGTEDIAPLNPIQMFQLGVESAERNDHLKASRIFRRAMQLGLDDFDIQFKLADACAAIGETEEAHALYTEFARKCLHQARRRDAIRAFRKITDIDPLNAETQRQLIELLIQDGRQEEAVVQGLTAAESLGASGSPRDALDHLLFMRDSGLEEKQLTSKILEYAELCGEKSIVDEELRKNPAQLEELLDVDKALEVYQKQFCDGNDSLEIRLKLVELHLQRGHRREVLAHINGILGGKHEKNIQEKKILSWLHKTRCSLEPGHMVSHRWMIEYYMAGDRKEKAMETLDRLIKHMEGAGEKFYVRDLQRLRVELDPEEYGPRWDLARFHQQHDDFPNAIREMESIADLAIDKKDMVALRKVWTEVLKIAPFHRLGLMRFAELLAESGEKEQALEKLKSVLQTDLACNNVSGAREVFNKIEALEPNDPQVASRFGLALVSAGETQHGVEHLVEAARGYLEQKDLGSARRALEAATEHDAENHDAKCLLEKLEGLEAALSGTPLPGGRAAPTTPEEAAANEAFQPRAPIRKTTVSAITARLKNLKSGGDKSSVFSGKQVVQSGIKSITENLKKARGAPEGDADAGDADAGDAGDAPSKPKVAPVSKKKGVGNVASRLKALAGGGDSGGGASKPAADDPPVKFDTGDEAPAASADSGGDSGPEQSSSGASGLGGALVEEKLKKMKAASSGAVSKKKNLGGPASRLAALRAKKEPVTTE